MVRRIAVYGKGGIGKSTVSSNLTAALSDNGSRVMQIGCDPKHDSTRGLMGGREQTTVLDYLKTVPPDRRSLDGVVASGYKGCLCVEAGGPEPGVGCAGRGIISSFDLLESLGSESIDADIVLYDVLGDVVCGGFAVPLRNGYADTVYIVTSGEFMSIYAANNILRGTANYDPDRIGGLIFNSRGDPEEDERIRRFSEAVGIPVIVRIPRSELFMAAEKQGTTVVESFPDSEAADTFRHLADTVKEGKRYSARFLSEHDLEKLILGRDRHAANTVVTYPGTHRNLPVTKKKTPYSSRNVTYGSPLGGCAFSGASATCTSVEGLAVVLHSPRSCAHFTMQLDGMSAIGAAKHNRTVVPAYVSPVVRCTDMGEEDMVFGGTGCLERTLEETIYKGSKDVAVITACPPGIIGDDCARICNECMDRHPGVKIALIAEDGNATGDFMQGVIDACIGMVETFNEPVEKKPFSVNLVGSKTMSSTVIDDLKIVTDLLERIGITVNCVLPGVTDMECIRHVPAASANLMLNTDLFSENICRFLYDKYGMPYLPCAVRGGISGTRDWLSGVADHFGVTERVGPVIESLESEFREMLSGPRGLLDGKKAVIISLSGDMEWLTESLDAAGIEVLKGYVFYRADYSVNLDNRALAERFTIFRSEDMPQILSEIGNMKPDILLSLSVADVDPSIHQFHLPCAPETDPFAGKELVYEIARGILAPAEEGWRKDVA